MVQPCYSSSLKTSTWANREKRKQNKIKGQDESDIKDNMCNWHYQDVIGGVLFVLPSQTLATSFIQTVSCFFKITHDNRWPEAMSASVCESSVMSRQIVFKSGLLLPDSTGQRCFSPPVTGALSLWICFFVAFHSSETAFFSKRRLLFSLQIEMAALCFSKV